MNPPPHDYPVDGVLDLHTFLPKEIPSLLDEYIAECRRKGITTLRIIHGKGTGTLRELVNTRLKRNPHVASHHLAPPESGGWGATIAILKHDNPAC